MDENNPESRDSSKPSAAQACRSTPENSEPQPTLAEVVEMFRNGDRALKHQVRRIDELLP